MNVMRLNSLCVAVILVVFTACGGGTNQFRLRSEQKAPSVQKAGEVLYDPLDVVICREILTSRSFYERHLRAQLNQRNYQGTWEDFWRSTKVIPEGKEFALVVVFPSRGLGASSQEFAEALAAALNEYSIGKASLAEGSHGWVKSVERVK